MPRLDRGTNPGVALTDDDSLRSDAQREVPRTRWSLRRALAPALAVVATLGLATGGCGFAVRHPAAAAALVGGSIAITTCEVGTDFDEHAACGGISLGAAVVLGGVVLLATALGGPGDTVLRAPAPAPTIEDPAPLPTIEDVPAPAPAPVAPAPAAPAPAPAS